jgi:hypothetical protein
MIGDAARDLQDLDSLRSGATGMDAVVHLAFSHDWSTFAQNAADEMKAIEALGSVMEPGRLLVVTSGVGLTSGEPGHIRTESDPPVDSPAVPRFRGGASGRHRRSRRRVCMWRLCVCRRCMTRANRA